MLLFWRIDVRSDGREVGIGRFLYDDRMMSRCF